MRAVWLVVLGACYQESAIEPCTLTCESAPCPGDLVCLSDHVCQAPGEPLCSTAPMPSGIYVKAPTPAMGAQFGSSVALSLDGGTLAVGAPLEGAGAVYVFTWDGTAYSLDARLVNPSGESGDQFGASVSLSTDGTVLAVGEPFEDSNATGINGNASDNSATDAGAVYTFTRTAPGAWTRKYIKLGVAGLQLGTSVAISGDGKFVAIGAPNDPGSSVYLFSGISNMMSGNRPVVTEMTDRVGASVAIVDGNAGTPAAVAGADREDSAATGFGSDATSNAAAESGAGHYVGYSSLFKYYFKPSNTGAGDQFGTAVGSSSTGAVMAFGAPNEDSNGGEADNSVMDSGAVYVFVQVNGTTWSQRDYMKAPAITAGGRFGQSLALAPDGTFIVIGAPGTSAAYAYEQIAGMWQARAPLAPANVDPGDELGASIALSRNHMVIAVGAPHEASASATDATNNAAANAGAVYVFR